MSSKKSLPARLFIKENYRIVLVRAPEDYQSQLRPFPEGVSISNEVHLDADLIQAFFMNREEMEQHIGSLTKNIDLQ